MFWRKKSKEPKEPEFDYDLSEFKSDTGNGYVLRRIADDQKLNWRTLALNTGMRAFNVAGVSYRETELQNKAFSPGMYLSVKPEPENEADPTAIAIYDQTGMIQVGYVPKEAKGNFDLAATCIVMWQERKGRKRVGIRALYIEPDVKIKLP